jgi:hypothetical protein
MLANIDHEYILTGKLGQMFEIELHFRFLEVLFLEDKQQIKIGVVMISRQMSFLESFKSVIQSILVLSNKLFIFSFS